MSDTDRYHIHTLYPSNLHFPHTLVDLQDAPKRLFFQGSPLQRNEKSITVIGTRMMTPYGASATQMLVKNLVRHGWTIISGLAFGIDALAHRTAIEHGGRTIAIVPSGLKVIAPTSHEPLARDILETGGALYSEYESHQSVQKYYFVQRNRILAGMSDATLVIEAGVRSGTQITVGKAGDYGKPVFAVPGPMFNPMSEGTKQFINMGAKLVTCVRDIEEEFGYMCDEQRKANTPLDTPFIPQHTKIENDIILMIQSHSCVSLGDMYAAFHNQHTQILHALTSLELSGKIRKDFGGYRLA